MKTLDDIHNMWMRRKTDLGPVHAKAMEVRDTYNSDLSIPMPELDESEKPAVANLTQVGIDQLGMRIASTLPAFDFPPLRRGIKKSEDYARIRKMAVQGWHEHNAIGRKLRRRARWLVGYGCAPIVLRPDPTLRIPCWELRHPLGTYASPSADPDELQPVDAIFAFKIGREDLSRRYPDAFVRLKKHKESVKFTLLEYVDAEEYVLMVVGDESRSDWTDDTRGVTPFEQLERVPNRTGLCPAIIPGRITLDRPGGQLDGIIGIYQAQAKIMALMMIGTQRSILPEQWMVSPEGRNARIVRQANALTGEIGEIHGGTLEMVRPEPSALANPLLDRLEYAERHTGGVPAQFGGQGPTNVRTGRAQDSIMSAVVDFPVQEAQERFEESLHAENVVAMEIAKHYFGNEKKSFYVQKHATEVDYTPNVHFETTNHRVRYAYTGADQNNLNIVAGQKIGMGTMSKRRYMEIDPMIPDVEAEEDRIVAEGLEAAFLSSIQTQAADPAGPFQPGDFARLVKLIESDENDLAGAVEKLQREVQERQAQQQAAQGPQGPEGMPGLATPGAPGAPVEAIGEVEPSVKNLGQMLGALRQPQMTMRSERAATG